MHAEGKVIEAHRRLWGRGMASRILRPDGRGVEEDRGANRVAGEAKAIEEGEVWGQPVGGAAAGIEKRLGIEG